MSFFDIGSMKETHVSLDVVKQWAGEVASGYLTAGIRPTDSLVKIARSEELTPHQVELLAGESNKLIHQAKFASVTDKYLAADFPLADAREALKALQASGEPKLAGLVPDPVCKSGIDPWDLFGAAPETMDKSASLKSEMRQVERKTGVLREKLAEEAYMAKCAADTCEREFIKQGRQMVLDHAFTAKDRMQILGSLEHFVKQANAPEIRPALAKLAYVLGGEGLLSKAQVKTAMDHFTAKVANNPVPDELISPFLKAQVVNGSHPIYVTLKTFKDHQARMNWARGNRSNVDDHLTIFKERISAL